MPAQRLQYVLDVDDKGSKVFKNFGQAAESAADDVADASKKASKGWDEAGGELEKSSGKWSGMISKVGPAVGAAALTVGVAAAAALAKGIGQAMEAQDLQAQMAAKLGLPPDLAAETGRAAGKIYAKNYGESLSEVNDAIASVAQNIRGLDEGFTPELDKITKSTLTLSKAFGQDLGGTTRAVGQLMKTGLAKNSQEAFDILTRGFQQGVNKADDLLDTVTEYGTQFRNLGLTGTQAMGLLSQGLRAGARDADLVADAIKEFNIRAQDGSKTSAAGFESLGLNAQKMTAVFAKGGPEAAKGLGTVLDRLRAIKDPADRSATAVALFGTQAEDLQGALYKLDLKTAAADMGDVAGATDRASEALGSTFSARIETLKRRAETSLTAVGAAVLGGLDRVGKSKAAAEMADDFRTKVVPALREFSTWVGDRVGPKARELFALFQTKGVPILRQQIPQALRAGRDAFRDIQNAIEKNKPQLRQLWSAFMAFASFIMTNWKTIGPIVGTTLRGIGLTIAGTITTLSLLSRGWHAAQSATQTATRFMLNAALASFGGVINAAARAFGWVPGIGPKLKSAAKGFNDFAATVNQALGGIKDQDVNVNVRLKGSAAALASVAKQNQQTARLGRAVGGPVQAGAPYIVGERGPELFSPGQSGRIVPNSALTRSGGGTVEVLQPIQLQLDSRTVWQGLLQIKNRGGRGYELGLA